MIRPSDSEIFQVVASAIADAHTFWSGADHRHPLPAGHRRTVIKEYAAQITLDPATATSRSPTHHMRRTDRQSSVTAL
jgi:hypothetical protein